MSDAKRPKKAFSIVQAFREKLIDALVTASQKWEVDKDGTNFEKLQEEQFAVLNTGDQKAKGAQEIVGQLAIDVNASRKFAEGAPWKLSDYIVSPVSWPFTDISEVDAHFGALQPGYCYRNLVSNSNGVSSVVANNANNLIRLPTISNLWVDLNLNRPGDGIPGRTLMDWLQTQSGDLNRRWILRTIAYLGLLESDEFSPVALQTVGISSARAEERGPSGNPDKDPALKPLVDKFIDSALDYYDCQEWDLENSSNADSISGAYAMKTLFHALSEVPGGCEALRPLLTHPEVSVSVTAAIYLLLSAPQAALPVLHQTLAQSSDVSRRHLRCACFHAQRALWMYRDGKLSYGPGPTS